MKQTLSLTDIAQRAAPSKRLTAVRGLPSTCLPSRRRAMALPMVKLLRAVPCLGLTSSLLPAFQAEALMQ